MRPTLILALFVVAGCIDAGREGEVDSGGCDLDALVGHRASNGALSLVACPVEDLVDQAGPLNVIVLLRNVTDSPVALVPNFVFGTWLDARIVGPTGSVLNSVSQIEPNVPEPVTLAPGGVIGAIVDLRCPAGDRLVAGEMGPGCIAPYELEVPGAYEVTMVWTYVCDYGICGTELQRHGELGARPFTVRIR